MKKHDVQWRLHAGAGKTFEKLFAAGQPLHWSRAYAAQLRAHEAASQQWQESQLSDVAAKLIIYRAFVDGELAAPSILIVTVHRNYFEPLHQEVSTRTLWRLCNAFTSAFKDLDPIPQFKVTAKFGEFLSKVQQS